MTILELDGNRCRRRGCGCRDNLEVHHIIPQGHEGPEEDWNKITLCHTCHELVTSKRLTDIKLLTEIIKVKDFRWQRALDWHLNKEELRRIKSAHLRPPT